MQGDQAGSVMAVFLWVASLLITKVGVKRLTLLFYSAEEGHDSCFVDLISCCLQSVQGNRACLKTRQVMPSGSVLGMFPMPCVSIIAGVFSCPAVLRVHCRRHSLPQLALRKQERHH